MTDLISGDLLLTAPMIGLMQENTAPVPEVLFYVKYISSGKKISDSIIIQS